MLGTGNGPIHDPAVWNTGKKFVRASRCRNLKAPVNPWISCVLQIVEKRRRGTGAVVHQNRCVVLVAVSFHDVRGGIASRQIAGGRPC